ncbi:MAG: DUF4440 domain-containing protein [Gammaproteobacteria bacterium]|nr:DUF4440 domain-containing protein [Gammaproteobacteria bacterium]
MNTLKSTIAALSLGLAIAACAPIASVTSNSSPATDEAAIRAAGDGWTGAFKASDPAALAAVYAADAVFMPETAETAKGRAAIGEFLKVYLGLLAEGNYTRKVSSAVDVEVAGDFAVRSGTYAITEADGNLMDTGKWLEVWRKRGGKWSISKAMWNSDNLPLFPPWAYKETPAPAAVEAPEPAAG